MHSVREFFPDFEPTIRTGLATAPVVNLIHKYISSFAYVLENRTKLTKCSINSMLAQKPFCHSAKINILHEDSIRHIAKLMGKFVLVIFSFESYMIMLFLYFQSGFDDRCS